MRASWPCMAIGSVEPTADKLRKETMNLVEHTLEEATFFHGFQGDQWALSNDFITQAHFHGANFLSRSDGSFQVSINVQLGSQLVLAGARHGHGDSLIDADT